MSQTLRRTQRNLGGPSGLHHLQSISYTAASTSDDVKEKAAACERKSATHQRKVIARDAPNSIFMPTSCNIECLLCSADAQPRLLQALGTSFQDLPYNLPGEVGFGLAPTDELDKTAPSSLVNLHLPTLRLLLAVRWDRPSSTHS